MNNSLKETLKKIEDTYNITYEDCDVSDFPKMIREKVLEKYYDSSILDNRFQIPDEYINFIKFVDYISDANNSWGAVYGGFTSIAQTEDLFEYHYCTKNSINKILINIGYWSDKHEYWLSCDKEHSYGKIFDNYDLNVEDLNEDSAEEVFENLERLLLDLF